MPRARLPCSAAPTVPGSPRDTRTRHRPLRSTTARALLVVRTPETHLPGRYCRQGRTRAGRRALRPHLLAFTQMFERTHHYLPRTLRAASLAGVAAARAHEGDFACAGF